MIKPKEIKSLLTHQRVVFEFSIFHLVWGFLLGLLVFFQREEHQLPSTISVHQVDYFFYQCT